MDNKLLDWIFDHMVIVMIIGVIVAVVITLAVYKDPRCLVAECRIIKK